MWRLARACWRTAKRGDRPASPKESLKRRKADDTAGSGNQDMVTVHDISRGKYVSLQPIGHRWRQRDAPGAL
jgi:hypothetical protein